MKMNRCAAAAKLNDINKSYALSRAPQICLRVSERVRSAAAAVAGGGDPGTKTFLLLLPAHTCTQTPALLKDHVVS